MVLQAGSPVLAKLGELEKLMKTMTADQAESSFEQFLEFVQREAVLLTKQNRPVGVFLSVQNLEDIVIGERALGADAEGYLGPEESNSFLNELLS